eukprot:TRINITY_DN66180_c2_g3_i1.p1 TRINITY_DN66180_c2_g3~~TRINITY_DN66180_c2_g3_i1.p1  ORF type:complete len:157 (+),score=9.51 TRINITY_DN66180_c2_g3_i1:88-558(+)
MSEPPPKKVCTEAERPIRPLPCSVEFIHFFESLQEQFPSASDPYNEARLFVQRQQDCGDLRFVNNEVPFTLMELREFAALPDQKGLVIDANMDRLREITLKKLKQLTDKPLEADRQILEKLNSEIPATEEPTSISEGTRGLWRRDYGRLIEEQGGC